MPRIVTEQMKREKALRVSVCRAKEEQDIRTDGDLAELLKIPKSTFYRHKNNSFQDMSLRDFAHMARRLKFTPKDLCDAIGVPYEEVNL